MAHLRDTFITVKNCCPNMIKRYVVHMKIEYNKKDEKEIRLLMGFEPAHNGKRFDLLVAATLPTKLSILTKIVFKTTPDF